MKRYLVAAVLALLSVATLAQGVKSLEESAVVIEGGGAARGTRVTVRTKAVPSRSVFLSSEAGQFPKTFRVITSLSISVKGKTIFVSRSVYADLAWVLSAELQPNLLIIQTGDASESSNVRISFDAERVREKSVFLGTDAKNLLERTTYHKVVIE